jgi:hypothetical protein
MGGNGATISATSAATAAVLEGAEGPVLAGDFEDGPRGASVLGATDTAFDSDDVLGNVTITGFAT